MISKDLSFIYLKGYRRGSSGSAHEVAEWVSKGGFLDPRMKSLKSLNGIGVVFF